MGRLRNLLTAASTLLIQSRIKGRDFSIISNNCWGAHIYQRLGMPYMTPTVGLWLDSDSYLRFVADLRANLAKPLTFIKTPRYRWIEEPWPVPYPVGLIGDDIEVRFQHYSSAQDAGEKWTRRAARVTANEDSIFLRFDDRIATPEQITAFDALPRVNKVCFVSKPHPAQSAVFVPGGPLSDGLALSRYSYRQFDAARWLNGDPRAPWRVPLLQSV